MPDGFDLDDDDDETPDTGVPDNSAIKAIRKAERAAVARAKAAEAERDELRAQAAEAATAQRKVQLGAIAIALGLTPGQAALVPETVEATKEAVGAWGVAHDLLRPENAPAEPAATSFVPVTGIGGVAPDRTISYEQWQVKYSVDPAAAMRDLEAGRVTGLPQVNPDGTFDIPML